ncbi:MAG: hypothetical protein ABR905_21840 [Terracidiphilus sp.]|jgi:hypothetical protein
MKAIQTLHDNAQSLAVHKGFGEDLPGNGDAVLKECANAAIDADAIAAPFLKGGIESFRECCNDVLLRIAFKVLAANRCLSSEDLGPEV